MINCWLNKHPSQPKEFLIDSASVVEKKCDSYFRPRHVERLILFPLFLNKEKIEDFLKCERLYWICNFLKD